MGKSHITEHIYFSGHSGGSSGSVFVCHQSVQLWRLQHSDCTVSRRHSPLWCQSGQQVTVSGEAAAERSSQIQHWSEGLNLCVCAGLWSAEKQTKTTLWSDYSLKRSSDVQWLSSRCLFSTISQLPRNLRHYKSLLGLGVCVRRRPDKFWMSNYTLCKSRFWFTPSVLRFNSLLVYCKYCIYFFLYVLLSIQVYWDRRQF